MLGPRGRLPLHPPRINSGDDLMPPPPDPGWPQPPKAAQLPTVGLAAVMLPSLCPMHSAPSSPRSRKKRLDLTKPLQPPEEATGETARHEAAWVPAPCRPSEAGAPEHDAKMAAALCPHGLRGHHPYSAPLSTCSRHDAPTERASCGTVRSL
jgi:hypothetical protein